MVSGWDEFNVMRFTSVSPLSPSSFLLLTQPPPHASSQVKRQRRRAKQLEREEAKKHAIAHVRQAEHTRGWNRSTQAGRMIHTPFQPLGPGSDNQTPEISEEKSLWPVMPQRFGAARPKIQWKAADSAGREFGNDAEMKLIPRKLRKEIKVLIRHRDRKLAKHEEKARIQKIIGGFEGGGGGRGGGGGVWIVPRSRHFAPRSSFCPSLLANQPRPPPPCHRRRRT